MFSAVRLALHKINPIINYYHKVTRRTLIRVHELVKFKLMSFRACDKCSRPARNNARQCQNMIRSSTGETSTVNTPGWTWTRLSLLTFHLFVIDLYVSETFFLPSSWLEVLPSRESVLFSLFRYPMYYERVSPFTYLRRGTYLHVVRMNVLSVLCWVAKAKIRILSWNYSFR